MSVKKTAAKKPEPKAEPAVKAKSANKPPAKKPQVQSAKKPRTQPKTANAKAGLLDIHRLEAVGNKTV